MLTVVAVTLRANGGDDVVDGETFAVADRQVLGGINRSSQHLEMEVDDGQTAWVMVTLTGRPSLRSPGRPPTRRAVERAFWGKIAEGLTSEDAAVACGVSGPVGSRWFRERGGMPTIELSPPTDRYLSFEERDD